MDKDLQVGEVRIAPRVSVSIGDKPSERPARSVRTHIPADFANATERPCAACRVPTVSVAEVPFRPDIGAVPLHLTCAGALHLSDQKRVSGAPLDQEEVVALIRLEGFLDGVAYRLELDS